MMMRKRNDRFQPEFCLSVRCGNMHVHSRFFLRKEEETVLAIAKDGWAHLLFCYLAKVPLFQVQSS